jgi:hypothetical protein
MYNKKEARPDASTQPLIICHNFASSEAKAKPVCAKDDGTQKDCRHDKKDNATAHPQTAIAKAKIALQPIINRTQKKKLQKTA